MAVKRGRNEVAQKVADALLGRPATLTLEIHTTEDDPSDRVRLTSFIGQLEAFKEVLRHTERVMYGSEGNVFYRIAELTKSSPPQITIEAIPATPHAEAFGPAIFEGVLERLETLAAAGPDWVPSELDLPAVLAYQEFAPTTKRHISELVVRNGGDAVRLDEGFSQNVREAIGPDQLSRGEVVGSLEVVNLHARPRFEVYPTLGEYKVVCHFPTEKKSDVIAALDRYVRVTGRLHYKRQFPHPHAVDLEEIEIFPEESELPEFERLRGIAPDVTDEQLRAAKNGLW